MVEATRYDDGGILFVTAGQRLVRVRPAGACVHMNHAAITGWGSYSPSRILTNQDLAQIVDTNDEWIRSRTGIAERHIAGPGESTSTMGVIAARRALEQAQLAPRDVDLVLCATTTPDYLLPATACLIQQQVGCTRA